MICVFAAANIQAQEFKFDTDLIKYRGLGLVSTKAEIIAKLGQPNKVFEPNYECGFFSSDEQGKSYYALQYGDVEFIGNDEEKYTIDRIEFKEGVTVYYGEYLLSNESDLDRLIEVFGMKKFGRLHETSTDSVVLFEEGSDGGIRFSLKNGKLSKIGYWSPC